MAREGTGQDASASTSTRSTSTSKHWLDFLAVLIASGSMAFSGWQVKIASERSAAEVRPYLMVENDNVPSLAVNKKGLWNIRYVNYGKTPALRAYTLGKIWTGRTALEDAAKYISSLPDIHDPQWRGATVPPTNKSDATGFTTLVTDEVASKDLLGSMREQDNQVVMAGRAYYLDVLRNRYSSDFCYRVLATGAIAECEYVSRLR
ncbi:hypothetical protein LQG66_36695 [Bradyrhizobium ontarionense]|uniref:Uncharacterized protein n=1 Tax=Bradyrhizobium ontarionense TaxID=2898149 RepID=A0ABY3RBA6_9BRAD|nr:hypothetical protein [Bradyrhizobium sp. A19]UFZ04659.1 hypothetical protein LQG66_36695 [Bradyrhizobium sp. A19]